MGDPATKKQEEDTRQMLEYFALIGWMDEDAITDDRLHKLLKRGIALKKEKEKAADKGDSLIDFTAWSQDGLQALQEANPAPPFDAEKATPAQKMNRPADNDFLKYSVRLLSNARWDELDKVQAWSGPTLQLGLFRMIRTQRFIDFTAQNIAAKEAKMQEEYAKMARKKKVLSKDQAAEFYDRLVQDAAKRNETVMKNVAMKKEKEQHITSNSAMFSKGKGK